MLLPYCTMVKYHGENTEMELVSIREFAEMQMVSYEAVRRQTHTYAEQLKGHIIKKGRTQYLDNYAVEFLSEKRKENAVIESKRNYHLEIRSLQEELENYKIKLLEAQNKIISLQERQQALETENIRNNLLLEINDENKKQMEQRLDTLQEKLEQAENEANSYQKSWFGFYRKK